MGFDINIACALNLCTDSGRPYFPDRGGAKVFDLTKIPEIPPEYRRFISMKGGVFYEYTRSFGCDETTVDAALFFDRFPPWDEVDIHEDDCESAWWTSVDHNKFHAAMQWFAEETTVNYIVRWSY